MEWKKKEMEITIAVEKETANFVLESLNIEVSIDIKPDGHGNYRHSVEFFSPNEMSDVSILGTKQDSIEKAKNQAYCDIFKVFFDIASIFAEKLGYTLEPKKS